MLWSSEKYLSLALSALPSVPGEEGQGGAGGLSRTWPTTRRALKVLEASAAMLKMSPVHFIAAKDADFDNMRQFYRTTKVKVDLH